MCRLSSPEPNTCELDDFFLFRVVFEGKSHIKNQVRIERKKRAESPPEIVYLLDIWH